MQEVLTDEEELRLRRECFEKLKPGALFDLGQQRWFIAIGQFVDDQDVWCVIELTDENRSKITKGQLCVTSWLCFSDMMSINVHFVPADIGHYFPLP